MDNEVMAEIQRRVQKHVDRKNKVVKFPDPNQELKDQSHTELLTSIGNYMDAHKEAGYFKLVWMILDEVATLAQVKQELEQ